MHEKFCTDFQATVDEYLIRHRSVIDIITKYQEASARVNRAIAKSITECGCVQVSAARQQVPENTDYSKLRDYVSSHLSGEPCEHCKEVLAKELGHSLFYLVALCNLTGLKLHEVMQQEYNTIATLGFFHLT
jgi:hypothetical protein